MEKGVGRCVLDPHDCIVVWHVLALPLPDDHPHGSCLERGMAARNAHGRNFPPFGHSASPALTTVTNGGWLLTAAAVWFAESTHNGVLAT
jgi:hypothetical protein